MPSSPSSILVSPKSQVQSRQVIMHECTSEYSPLCQTNLEGSILWFCKKRRRKTMLRAPNVNQGNDESPFLQIFQTEKVFVNFSAAKIWNLYFCWQCHCKNWVVKIENAPRRKIWIQRVTQDSFCSSLKKISFLEISSDIKD